MSLPSTPSPAAGSTPRPAPPLVLDGELTISRVGELKPRLGAALAAGGPLQLDLAGVERIDSAGLQLLLALARECPQPPTLVGPAPCVRSLIDLYRVGECFRFAGSQGGAADAGA